MHISQLSLDADVEMEVIVMNPRAENNENASCVAQLDNDLKRVLTVQFKEFIHHIEDNECVARVDFSGTRPSSSWISLYDRKIA